jgi:uncharacterized protein YkwD
MKKFCFFKILFCFICGVLLCYSSAVARPFREWSAPEQLVLDLVNLQRGHHGLNWLKANDELQEAARLHSLDMGSNNYFNHTSQDGTTFDERVTVQGYQWSYVGENIAAGYADAYAVMYGTGNLNELSSFDESLGYGGFASWQEVGDNWSDSDWNSWQSLRENQGHSGGWMGSSGHRNNILNNGFVDIGIGYAYVVNSDYRRYRTQDFGAGDSNPEEIPSTPQSPSASDGTYQDYVKISWHVTSNVDICIVVRCSDQGLDNCIEIYRGEVAKTIDEPAQDMVTYYYRIRGCNESGCSGYSPTDIGYRDSAHVPQQSQPNIIPVIQMLLN